MMPSEPRGAGWLDNLILSLNAEANIDWNFSNFPACKYAQLFTKAASTILPYSECSVQYATYQWFNLRYFLQAFSNPWWLWWRCWKLALWHFYLQIMELPGINYCYKGRVIMRTERINLNSSREVTAETFSSSPEILNVVGDLAYISIPR